MSQCPTQHELGSSARPALAAGSPDFRQSLRCRRNRVIEWPWNNSQLVHRFQAQQGSREVHIQFGVRRIEREECKVYQDAKCRARVDKGGEESGKVQTPEQQSEVYVVVCRVSRVVHGVKGSECEDKVKNVKTECKRQSVEWEEDRV